MVVSSVIVQLWKNTHKHKALLIVIGICTKFSFMSQQTTQNKKEAKTGQDNVVINIIDKKIIKKSNKWCI